MHSLIVAGLRMKKRSLADITSINPRCTVCRKSFQLSNMGSQAMKSHVTGDKCKL